MRTGTGNGTDGKILMLLNTTMTFDGIDATVSVLRFREIDDEFARSWADLERRAPYGNAFLSPNFILPAVKYLTPKNQPLLLVVRRHAGGPNSIIGIGVFEYSPGTLKFPLPHLKAYRTPHSYLGGVLVDGEHMKISMDAIFGYINRSKHLFGLEFRNLVENNDLAAQIEKSGIRCDMVWFPEERKRRAILIPEKMDEKFIDGFYSKKKRKALRRQYNYLARFGDVHWKILSGRRIDSEVIDRFMKLEHMGWKGRKGSSLLTNSNDEKFFREMIGNFAREERVFFTELSVNDRVIASTSNLISSRTGFAFKIGWDTEFTPAGPGILNEFGLIKDAAKSFRDLEYIDSGAEEGSFIEELWPDRISLVSGMYGSKFMATPVMGIIKFARKLKKALPIRNGESTGGKE